MEYKEIRKRLSNGLLSFPITDFDKVGDFSKGTYEKRIEWQSSAGACSLFAAGGTGEFFSLTLMEYSDIVKIAVDNCPKDFPVFAGVGGGTRVAIEYAKEAERNGANGILLLPHYLMDADSEGIASHIREVCKSVKISVVLYIRGLCQPSAVDIEKLVEECPNIIALKDGVGDLEKMVLIRSRVGDRITYIGGLPTAELYATAYKNLGFTTYSSAVYNFIPDFAIRFYSFVFSGNIMEETRLIDDFFVPYLQLRNSKKGYAVSIVKAGASIVGRSAGPVRPPLFDLDDSEKGKLRTMIEKYLTTV